MHATAAAFTRSFLICAIPSTQKPGFSSWRRNPFGIGIDPRHPSFELTRIRPKAALTKRHRTPTSTPRELAAMSTSCCCRFQGCPRQLSPTKETVSASPRPPKNYESTPMLQPMTVATGVPGRLRILGRIRGQQGATIEALSTEMAVSKKVIRTHLSHLRRIGAVSRSKNQPEEYEPVGRLNGKSWPQTPGPSISQSADVSSSS